MPNVDLGLRHSRYEGFRATIKTVGTGVRGSRALTFDEARDALAGLLAGEITDAQAGAFLIAMRIKGEQPDELAGMTQALRDAAPSVRATTERPLVACAGAYDGTADAPQLSLAAGVAAASCGAGVVMHCGDTLGPKYGTTVADVLAALGGPGRPTLTESRAMLERSGACVVHAGAALPGWSRLAELRDEIGLRGPVHSAEKLVDWFGARRFVVGHTHGLYAERLVGALERLGAECAIAVRGIEGSDVMRPGRPVAHQSGHSLELPELLGRPASRCAERETTCSRTPSPSAPDSGSTRRGSPRTRCAAPVRRARHSATGAQRRRWRRCCLPLSSRRRSLPSAQ